ncbi:MAG TPA: GNAT family N-acetyltransferase [bacterium]|jgi:ribosomal protein S18 acetylase RimI-like enzyme|nr:GNAT family N-acetyltransferase [bacterium]
MDVFVFTDLSAFSKAVSPFLEAREAEYCLFFANLENPPPIVPFMAQVRRGDETVFAAFLHDVNLIVSRGPLEAVRAVADRLGDSGIALPGVVGPGEEAGAMADAWAKRRGCESFLEIDQGIYRITDVRKPLGIPGRMRPAVAGDKELLADWIQGFRREMPPRDSGTRDAAVREAEKKVLSGAAFIWELEGTPVSMAALVRPARRGITVTWVYTPPEFRRRGYATALVAAVSQEGLLRGKEYCTLYTDLSNPTSNSIYRKIGYVRIGDSRNFRFRYA